MTREERSEICYECTGYGDDYYLDYGGNWVCACDNCWINDWDDDDLDDDLEDVE